jgi:hypothetical protein
MSVTVGDTKASKEVVFTVQQSPDGKIAVRSIRSSFESLISLVGIRSNQPKIWQEREFEPSIINVKTIGGFHARSRADRVFGRFG